MNPVTFRWLLRRELWEHRAVYLAPLAVAVIALVGFFIHAPRVTEGIRGLAALDPARQVAAVVTPYGLAASVILLTCWIVGGYYCLDALYGERRDRSILFWKSMPVSDLATVLSKATVALVILPIVGCAIALATQLVMLLASTVALAAGGADPAAPWNLLPMLPMTVAMFYGMAVHALWFAPIYGWLLLVSAWARRATFLWAFMPFFAAYVLESIAFGTRYVSAFLTQRFMGAMARAFAPGALKHPITELSQLTPLQFLATPGLWIGLAFAAAFIVAAVRVRRYREPI